MLVGGVLMMVLLRKDNPFEVLSNNLLLMYKNQVSKANLKASMEAEAAPAKPAKKAAAKKAEAPAEEAKAEEAKAEEAPKAKRATKKAAKAEEE